MYNDADQYVRVADRIVPTGTSLPPFARFGSKADKPSQAKIQICPLLSESGQNGASRRMTRSANSGLMHRSKQHLYSITSSARVSSDGGIVKPSALAVLRLMTNSNLVGC